MENNSNTTNNVSNEFTTTTTAVEITPAELEFSKLQGELETIKVAHELSILNEIKLNSSMTCIFKEAVNHLSSRRVADVICSLPSDTIREIIKEITNFDHNAVADGIAKSDYADKFNTEIEDLDDYIADAYGEEQIVDLIDNKYSWSMILKIAFRRGVVDNSDVVDYLDLQDIIDDELRSGNIEFSDMMQHFDNSDCFDHLDRQGEMTWHNVKDYVDMDDVKSDIEIDTDAVTDYISNLDDSEFRNLFKNIY